MGSNSNSISPEVMENSSCAFRNYSRIPFFKRLLLVFFETTGSVFPALRTTTEPLVDDPNQAISRQSCLRTISIIAAGIVQRNQIFPFLRLDRGAFLLQSPAPRLLPVPRRTPPHPLPRRKTARSGRSFDVEVVMIRRKLEQAVAVFPEEVVPPRPSRSPLLPTWSRPPPRTRVLPTAQLPTTSLSRTPPRRGWTWNGRFVSITASSLCERRRSISISGTRMRMRRATRRRIIAGRATARRRF